MERREQYCSGESPEQASSKGPEKGLSSEEGASGRLAVRSHALTAVKRSWSFEKSWQRCRQSLGGDRNARGTALEDGLGRKRSTRRMSRWPKRAIAA
jgi:hypothetical protein